MLDHGVQSILRRKTAGMRQRPEPAPVTPERALTLALGKASRQVLQLDTLATVVLDEILSLAELLELTEDLSLFAVLEGPRDALGLLAISPGVLAGLIEMQTTGRVTASEAPARRPTRTDAVMTATFIDCLMQGFEEGLSGTPDEIWAGGFRYASFLPEARPLALILDDAPLRVFRIDVRLAAGLRRGEVLLAVPARGRGVLRRPLRDRASAAALTQQDGRAWSEALSKAVLAAPAEVEAVLHRMTLPLSAVAGFAPGTLVPLPAAALDHVILQGKGGRPLIEGQLGALKGLRALRLCEADSGADGDDSLEALAPAPSSMPDLPSAPPLAFDLDVPSDEDADQDPSFPMVAPIVGDFLNSD
ncbi:FliM/FliN family flagellar motor switch protein [Plastorhodobacter daqingensis]|uniref:FliM/FliN family flagellar motor switch protein n=1 Tax=Plastorhodobacter daqingensis TaxID=1387281 RepID=A0ABW2UJA6_9RHOB